MNNKKSKKKLFAIIGGSVLAFVLTVVVSVAVTLAYFGDQTTANDTITMGQALTFDTAEGKVATVTSDVDVVLPGAQGELTVAGNIAKTTTKAYIRMKVVPSGDGATSIVLGTNYTCADGTFVSSGTDGYYYLVKTADQTSMQDLDASGDAGKALSIEVPYTVDPTLTNDVAEDELTVTITLEIIQAENVGTTLAEVVAVWEADDVVVD